MYRLLKYMEKNKEVVPINFSIVIFFKEENIITGMKQLEDVRC